MTEYTAMIYRNNRNRTYIANCMIVNVVGFGKTEEDAIKNLKDSLQMSTKTFDIDIKPLYKLTMANS